jgi:hypothetical protein
VTSRLRCVKLITAGCALVALVPAAEQNPAPPPELVKALAQEWTTPEGAVRCLEALQFLLNGGLPPTKLTVQRARDALLPDLSPVSKVLGQTEGFPLMQALLTAVLDKASDPTDPKKLLALAKSTIDELKSREPQALGRIGAESTSRPPHALYLLLLEQSGGSPEGNDFPNLPSTVSAKQLSIDARGAAVELVNDLSGKLDVNALNGHLDAIKASIDDLKQDKTDLATIQTALEAAQKQLDKAADSISRTSAYAALIEQAGKLDVSQTKTSDDARLLSLKFDAAARTIGELSKAQSAPPKSGSVTDALKKARDAANYLDDAQPLADKTIEAMRIYRLCYRQIQPNSPNWLADLISGKY